MKAVFCFSANLDFFTYQYLGFEDLMTNFAIQSSVQWYKSTNGLQLRCVFATPYMIYRDIMK